MSARAMANKATSHRTFFDNHQNEQENMEQYAQYVFTLDVMKKRLPKEAYDNVFAAMHGKQKIQPEYADAIAVAMREWAISLGASHYCHWFQPLTGMSAEKHDSFIDWKTPDIGIEKFSGKELVQGEPDASSFPSGGLRTTYEARGYTGWDPTSPAFVWQAGDGMTLYIPSIFFSWTGDVLDNKIPLLRSDEKINQACLRLLNYTGTTAEKVYSTLGMEQEYFVIDRALRDLRPDLLILGRAVFGAEPPKGQEMQDHYFGSVKDRILSYMKSFEEEALKLGIPVKTRHNEVAPAQHEVAPVFERSSLSIDHNIMLMELMRRVAVKHGLACLLHEKPFDGLNGSGKHHNWALSTDSGYNLLDPTDAPEKSLQFLIILTAILQGIHRHADLLRASVGSAGNDYRLGGHEAPPAIISVYLGSALEMVLENICNNVDAPSNALKSVYNLGLSSMPDLSKDQTDRNRTSPFAFTGNKFEFRAVGSSASGAFPATVLNAIVAESLNEIIDQIEQRLPANPSYEDFAEYAMPVIRQSLISSQAIRFTGDNYSQEWKEEAKRRGLNNHAKAFHSFSSIRDEKTASAFQEILSPEELKSRYEIVVEQYTNVVQIETKLMIEMFSTQIFPAAVQFQKNLAESIECSSRILGKDLSIQRQQLEKISTLIEEALAHIESLKEIQQRASQFENSHRANIYCDEISAMCRETKTIVDELEGLVDDELWPLPKTRELLFLV